MLRFLSKLLASRGRRQVPHHQHATMAIMAVLAVAGMANLPTHAEAQEKRSNVNPQAETVKGFHDRVAAYIKLQQAQEKALPRMRKGENPEAVEAHTKALAAHIREARKDARRGDLFADASDLFRTTLAKDQASRSRAEKQETRKEVPARQPPPVNGEYPTAAPVATVPPLLLKQLPPLPDGLEYRFMERDLILRDTHANIIADVLPDVLPGR